MHDRSTYHRIQVHFVRATAPALRLVIIAAVSMAALGGCAGNDEDRGVGSVAAPKAAGENTVQRIGAEMETTPTKPEVTLATASDAPYPAATPPVAVPTRRGFLGSLLPPSVASSAAETTTSTLSPRKQPQPPGPSLDARLLFFPAKFPAGDWQPFGLRYEDASFTSADGTKLHGWYCPSEQPTAVILYCHGNAGNLSYDAELFRLLQSRLRATVLGFDYRGYGKSEGRATAAGATADARAARAWLAAKAGVPESSIVLMGRSLGGAVAVQLASDVAPRGLILESTFASLRGMAELHYPLLSKLVPVDKFDSSTALARYSGPLLQSHGDKDRTIPIDSGRALFLVAKGRKEFYEVTGGDHNDPQPAEYYDKLIRFVAELP